MTDLLVVVLVLAYFGLNCACAFSFDRMSRSGR